MSEQIRLRANRQAPESINDNGVIVGCSITTVGPALGHGVHLDESFIQECYEQASNLKLGLKARFGHPQMCNEALGTYLGRFKNFSVSKDGQQLFGDLHFGKSASKTPHGDLASYVAQYAKDDPESFGTSICFTVGGHYRIDEQGNEVNVTFSADMREEYEDFEGDPEDLSEELYVRCGKLMGCDFVDEPAANPSGLFSSATPAGQVAKLFSENPEIEKILLENDNIVDIIEKYGVNIKQFLHGSKNNMENEQETHEDVEVHEFNESTVDASEQVVEDTPVEDTPVEEPEIEEADPSVEDEPEALSVEDFKGLLAEFGADIATCVFDSCGTREDALEMSLAEAQESCKALAEENEKLRGEIAGLKGELQEYASDGVTVTPEVPKKRSLTEGLKL